MPRKNEENDVRLCSLLEWFSITQCSVINGSNAQIQ